MACLALWPMAVPAAHAAEVRLAQANTAQGVDDLWEEYPLGDGRPLPDADAGNGASSGSDPTATPQIGTGNPPPPTSPAGQPTATPAPAASSSRSEEGSWLSADWLIALIALLIVVNLLIFLRVRGSPLTRIRWGGGGRRLRRLKGPYRASGRSGNASAKGYTERNGAARGVEDAVATGPSPGADRMLRSRESGRDDQLPAPRPGVASLSSGETVRVPANGGGVLERDGIEPVSRSPEDPLWSSGSTLLVRRRPSTEPHLADAEVANAPEKLTIRRWIGTDDRVGLALAALAAAIGVCALISVRATDLEAMSGLGLPSVLPIGFYVAVAALLVSFAVTLARAVIHPLALAIHVIALIAALYGIAPLIEGVPRTAIAWKISGIPDYISVQGTVDPAIDAFFNWPGFFALVAMFTDLAGFENPTDFGAWAPVFFNALYVLPVFVLSRSATVDPRAPWLAVWIFLLGNWIGQDYLAPQAMSYFTFLVVLTVLLSWFTRPSQLRVPHTGERLSRLLRSWTSQSERATLGATPRQRTLLLGIVVLVVAAMVPSHQLTPFATLAAVGALVLAGLLTTRGLPGIILLLGFAWLGFMAVSYLEGHFQQVVSPVGSLGENVDANYTDRLQGSPDHVLVAYMRSATSALIWGMALVGGIRVARGGRLDLPIAILALAPFALLPLQTYGGELLLRIYLFTLPAMAFLAAKAFLPFRATRHGWLTVVSIALASALIAGGGLLSRYGDEQAHYFPPEELAAVQELYRIAPPGSRFVALFDSVPWRYREYKTYKYLTSQKSYEAGGAAEVATFLRSSDRRTFLIVTRSQLARGEMSGGWTRDTWPELETALRRSGTVRKLYANEHARIYGVPVTAQGRFAAQGP